MVGEVVMDPLVHSAVVQEVLCLQGVRRSSRGTGQPTCRDRSGMLVHTFVLRASVVVSVLHVVHMALLVAASLVEIFTS